MNLSFYRERIQIVTNCKNSCRYDVKFVTLIILVTIVDLLIHIMVRAQLLPPNQVEVIRYLLGDARNYKEGCL